MKDFEGILLKKLHDREFMVGEISDLYRKNYNYRSVIPILMRFLDPKCDPRTLEQIIRALSVKWAKPAAAPALVRLFSQVEDESGLGLRRTIANALAVVADGSVCEDIIRYAEDKKFGRSREMLALALIEMKSPKVDDVLIKLLDDDDIVGHALIAWQAPC